MAEEIELKREDILDFCERVKVPIAAFVGFWRRCSRGRADITQSDVVYAMVQAHLAGLPPIGPWYSFIPAKTPGEAPSACLRVDAAFFIHRFNPDADGPLDYKWVDSKGKEYPSDSPPTFEAPTFDKEPGPEAKTARTMDMGLRCVVSGKLKSKPGKIFTMACVYREWMPSTGSKAGAFWYSNPATAIKKQTIKEWVRHYLGASAEWEDAEQYAQTEAIVPARVQPATAEAVAEQTGVTVDVASRVIENSGMTPSVAAAAIEEAASAGVDPAKLAEGNGKKREPAKAKKEAKPKQHRDFTGIPQKVTPKPRQGTSQGYLEIVSADDSRLYCWKSDLFESIVGAVKGLRPVVLHCQADVPKSANDTVFWNVEAFDYASGSPEPSAPEPETPQGLDEAKDVPDDGDGEPSWNLG